MTIRFHLDENVDAALADALRRRDIDLTTSAEMGLNGAPDHKQLEFARANQRVLVSHDADFLRLANQGVAHAGIVFCRLRTFSIGRVALALVALRRHRTAEEMIGRVEFL